MSITNQEVINQALLEINVIEDGDSANADQSSDTLQKLNQMMAEWAVSDKDLHFFPQSDLTDVCPIPIWAEDGVVNNLAVKCAPSFAFAVSALLYEKAKSGSNVIARTCMNLKLKNTDMSHLPAGNGYRSNILTDSL